MRVRPTNSIPQGMLVSFIPAHAPENTVLVATISPRFLFKPLSIGGLKWTVTSNQLDSTEGKEIETVSVISFRLSSMMKMRQYLTRFWLLAVLLFAFTSTVQAQFTFTTNSDNTLTITGYTGVGGLVTIPSPDPIENKTGRNQSGKITG